MALWRILEARFATTESPWEHPTIGLGIQNFFKPKFPEKNRKKTSYLGNYTDLSIDIRRQKLRRLSRV